MRARRVVLFTLGVVLLGAAANVVIALGCALWSPAGRDRYSSPKGSERLWDQWAIPQSIRGSAFRSDDMTVHLGFGVRVTELVAEYHTPGLTSSARIDASKLIVQTGWPFASMNASTTYAAGLMSSPPSSTPWAPAINEVTFLRPAAPIMQESIALGYGRAYRSHLSTITRPIPLGIIWPGVVLGSFFWSGAIIGPFLGTRLVRRYRRLLRGNCHACAYPMSSANLCSECGTALPPRGTTPEAR